MDVEVNAAPGRPVEYGEMFPIEEIHGYQSQDIIQGEGDRHGSATFLTAATGPTRGCFITVLASLDPIAGCTTFTLVADVDVAVVEVATETEGIP